MARRPQYTDPTVRTWIGSGRPPEPSTTSTRPCARCGSLTSERWWVELGERDRWVCRDERRCRQRIARERSTQALRDR